MTAIAPQASDGRVSVGHDARDVATTVLVGAAAGALAGLVVGGLAGRLVMFALRVLSDPIVIGATSDDGFEIGRFTLGGSFQLAGAMAAAGAANGILYVVLRDAIPARARAPLWSLFAAAVGGSQFVHADGHRLHPARPALARRALVRPSARSRRARRGPARGALARGRQQSSAAPRTRDRRGDGHRRLVLGAVAVAAVLGARRLGLAGRLAVVGRLVVPAALVIGTVVGAWVTIDEASQILG